MPRLPQLLSGQTEKVAAGEAQISPEEGSVRKCVVVMQQAVLFTGSGMFSRRYQ
jgi:hypothetical protein